MTTHYVHQRRLLAFGILAPVVALAATLAAVAAYPGFDHSRQYLSELGGAKAPAPLLFNIGVFAAGVMAAIAGLGFGMAVHVLARARVAATVITLVFVLSGWGLTQAALYVWPDPRHLAINLALGIQIAPLLLLWGLRKRRDFPRLKTFLIVAFAAMAVLTVITKHLIFNGLVNDANVGWWERAYAVILVGWVGVAAFLIDRRLACEPGAPKTVLSAHRDN